MGHRWSSLRARPVVRYATVAIVFAAASALQIYLANMPLPVSVEDSGAFSPAVADRERERLVVERPLLPPGGAVLLSYLGGPDEDTALILERGRLSDSTRRQFERLGLEPPTAMGAVSYRTGDEAAPADGERCRTAVVVLDPFARAMEVVLQQHELPGLSPPLSLLVSSDAPFTLRLETTPPRGLDTAAGCRKRLILDGWEQVVSIPVEIEAEAGDVARLIVDGLHGRDTSASFQLGFEQAGGVRLEPIDATRRSVASSAVAPGRGAPLDLGRFSVAAERVSLEVSGMGKVTVRGKEHTVDLIQRIKRYPLLGGLLGAGNTALIGWFLSVFRGRRESD